MRTQFLYVGLLSMTLAGGLVSAGCDSNHTGQPSDPSGPVKLVRAIIEDDDSASQGAGGERGIATDLLDKPGTPLSTAVSCDVNLKPCLTQYNFNFSPPDFSCSSDTGTGTCADPLAPTGTVQIEEPDGLGGSGGVQIRLVFNKLIQASKIETITPIAGANPGMNETYALNAGVVDLMGPDGVVSTTQYWDPSGSPVNTSDVIVNPFGPAIVIKPNAPLLTSTNYTIVVHTGTITDRKGNPMGDQNGNVLTGDYSLPFTTEALTELASSPAPDATTMVTTLATDGVLSFTFQADLADPTAAGNFTYTLTPAPPAGDIVFAYLDQTQDPTTMMCTPTVPGGTLHITLATAAGVPVAWPAGDYTLAFTVKSLGGDVFDATATPLAFTVDPTVATGGADSTATFLTPSQCAH